MHTHKRTQVDLLAKLCAMPGNGMIVDCRGFDRGIWLVWSLCVCVCVCVLCVCERDTHRESTCVCEYCTQSWYGLLQCTHTGQAEKHTHEHTNKSYTIRHTRIRPLSLLHTHTCTDTHTCTHRHRAEITVPPQLYSLLMVFEASWASNHDVISLVQQYIRQIHTHAHSHRHE